MSACKRRKASKELYKITLSGSNSNADDDVIRSRGHQVNKKDFCTNTSTSVLNNSSNNLALNGDILPVDLTTAGSTSNISECGVKSTYKIQRTMTNFSSTENEVKLEHQRTNKLAQEQLDDISPPLVALNGSDSYLVNVAKLRYMNGECPTCGMKTFDVDGSIRIPINKQFILDGRCLLCHPPPLATTAPIIESTNSSSRFFACAAEPQMKNAPPARKKEISSTGQSFTQAQVNQISDKRFQDDDLWGGYTGDIDNNSKRHGRGVMKYDNGAVYDGEWQHDMADGTGTYRWPDGDIYSGEWKKDVRHGTGIYRWSNDEVDVQHCEDDEFKGEGVRWSADRKTAWRLINGEKQSDITLQEAASIAERIGISIPE